MFFNGLSEMRIKNIYVENVTISSKFGAELLQTESVTLKNVQIFPEQGPKMALGYSDNVTLDGQTY